MDAFAFSAQGYAHLQAAIPCQDRSRAWTDGRAGAIAAADGHGGREYARSAVGAKRAATISLKWLRLALSRWRTVDHKKLAFLSGRILREWRVSCRKHFRAHPLTASERARLGPHDGQFRPSLYGATLLYAAMTPGFCFISQIGDGLGLRLGAADEADFPVPDDPRLCGQCTTSLCDAGAKGEFRHWLSNRPGGTRAILLCTDGVADSYAPASLALFGEKIAAVWRENRAQGCEQLRAWLPELSRRGSGDDMSIAGLVRM